MKAWGRYVRQETSWEATRVEGYQAVAVDVTAVWRPTLKNCPSQHYHPSAGRALPAVIIGLAGEVGTLNGQRLTVPRHIERVHPHDGSESRLWTDLLGQVRKGLDDTDVVVVDAGVKISQLHDSHIDRYVVRLASNFSAGRNVLPVYTRGRKPRDGLIVRPLPRTRKQQTIPATPPDEQLTWQHAGRTLDIQVWRPLVLPKTVPHPSHKTFTVYAFHDPAFKQPWLLATSLPLTAQSVYLLYTHRWSVEQLPLAAKQMLGAHRQFVHAGESVHRLPELALLAGSVLSVPAASTHPLPTGFWDRHPTSTPGRFRRALFGQPFPKEAPLPGQFRKKRSVTDHLPKGNLARLPDAPPSQPKTVPLAA